MENGGWLSIETDNPTQRQPTDGRSSSETENLVQSNNDGTQKWGWVVKERKREREREMPRKMVHLDEANGEIGRWEVGIVVLCVWMLSKGIQAPQKCTHTHKYTIVWYIEICLYICIYTQIYVQFLLYSYCWLLMHTQLNHRRLPPVQRRPDFIIHPAPSKSIKCMTK